MKHSKLTMTPIDDVSFDLGTTYMWIRIDWWYISKALLLERKPNYNSEYFFDEL